MSLNTKISNTENEAKPLFGAYKVLFISTILNPSNDPTIDNYKLNNDNVDKYLRELGFFKKETIKKTSKSPYTTLKCHCEYGSLNVEMYDYINNMIKNYMDDKPLPFIIKTQELMIELSLIYYYPDEKYENYKQSQQIVDEIKPTTNIKPVENANLPYLNAAKNVVKEIESVEPPITNEVTNDVANEVTIDVTNKTPNNNLENLSVDELEKLRNNLENLSVDELEKLRDAEKEKFEKLYIKTALLNEAIQYKMCYNALYKNDTINASHHKKIIEQMPMAMPIAIPTQTVTTNNNEDDVDDNDDENNMIETNSKEI